MGVTALFFESDLDRRDEIEAKGMKRTRLASSRVLATANYQARLVLDAASELNHLTPREDIVAEIEAEVRVIISKN